MGISVQASGIQVEKNKYYLVNLNDDPSLNELLVYYLKVRARRGGREEPYSSNVVHFSYPRAGANSRGRSLGQGRTGHPAARLGYPAGTLRHYDRRVRPVHDALERCSVFRERHASREQDPAVARRQDRLGKPSLLPSQLSQKRHRCEAITNIEIRDARLASPDNRQWITVYCSVGSDQQRAANSRAEYRLQLCPRGTYAQRTLERSYSESHRETGETTRGR